MPEDNQLGQKAEVKEQTQVEMPTTEIKPADTTDAKVDPSVEVKDALPEDASERTKQQFEKLTQANKELAKKLAIREQQETNSLIDSLSKPVQQEIVDSKLPEGKVDDIVKDLTDENGYINEALLKKTLSDANTRANEAVQTAKAAQDSARKANDSISRYEQGENTKKAYIAFPQSNPDSDDFDPKFVELVKNEMIGQAMNRIKPNFYEACNKWSKQLETTPKPKQETVAAKEQINPGGTAQAKPVLDKDSLVAGTNKGDKDAINARLAAIGI